VGKFLNHTSAASRIGDVFLLLIDIFKYWTKMDNRWWVIGDSTVAGVHVLTSLQRLSQIETDRDPKGIRPDQEWANFNLYVNLIGTFQP